MTETTSLRTVCVYAGSAKGERPAYAEAAQQLGRLLAQQGLGLVYGGGRVGLMGVIADAVLEAGGHVVGVIPKGLATRELAHTGLNELLVVESMHERKARMADLADAFVALPGGYGTLEELVEILTWAQLGIHHKPCGLLNVAGYYDRLLSMLAHAEDEGFLRAVHRTLLLSADTPHELLERLRAYQSPVITKWLDRSQT